MESTSDFLDQLEAWLEDFADQEGAERIPYWLNALRRLRSAVRPLEYPARRSMTPTVVIDTSPEGLDTTLEAIEAIFEGGRNLRLVR